MKLRLDRLLVERGLADSREKAQALIMAGEVLMDGQKALKPGHSVDNASRIEVTGRPLYVSRGGLKLEAALAKYIAAPATSSASPARCNGKFSFARFV